MPSFAAAAAGVGSVVVVFVVVQWQYRPPLPHLPTDRTAEVKYIDPTYMIRAIGPNANDSGLASKRTFLQQGS